jgi:hypothetical protein
VEPLHEQRLGVITESQKVGILYSSYNFIPMSYLDQKSKKVPFVARQPYTLNKGKKR